MSGVLRRPLSVSIVFCSRRSPPPIVNELFVCSAHSRCHPRDATEFRCPSFFLFVLFSFSVHFTFLCAPSLSLSRVLVFFLCVRARFLVGDLESLEINSPGTLADPCLFVCVCAELTRKTNEVAAGDLLRVKTGKGA